MAAKTPEDVDRLFEDRINAGDLDGVLALYEPGATLVLPEGDITGTTAFRDSTSQMLAARPPTEDDCDEGRPGWGGPCRPIQ